MVAEAAEWHSRPVPEVMVMNFKRNQSFTADHVVETYAAFTVRDSCFSGRLYAAHSHDRPPAALSTSSVTCFHGLCLRPSISRKYNFRTENRQFETFTTHIFNQHDRCSSATTGYTERIRASSVSTRSATLCTSSLFRRSRIRLRSHKLTFFTAERRGVNAEEHRHGRLHQRTAPAASFNAPGSVIGVGMFSSPRPVIAMISPASAISLSIRSRPRCVSTYLTSRYGFPSLSMIVTCWFGFTLPRF